MIHQGYITNTAGVTIAFEYSEAVDKAMDIMLDDKVPADRAASLALAAERTGRDPVAFAEHFVKVRREFRAMKQG